jgi:hypothetical protein
VGGQGTSIIIRLPTRVATVRATIRIDAAASDFRVSITRQIAENGDVMHARAWSEIARRDFPCRTDALT